MSFEHVTEPFELDCQRAVRLRWQQIIAKEAGHEPAQAPGALACSAEIVRDPASGEENVSCLRDTSECPLALSVESSVQA